MKITHTRVHVLTVPHLKNAHTHLNVNFISDVN